MKSNMKERISTITATTQSLNGERYCDNINSDGDADSGAEPTDCVNTGLDNAIDKLPPVQPILSKQSTYNNQNVKQNSTTIEKRVERNLWRPDEVLCMLYAMQSIKAIEQLNNKNVKSEKVFKNVERIMFSNGFRKKSHAQIWTKWKFLKSTYNTSRRNGIMPRIVSPDIYKQLHIMLQFKNVKSNGSGKGSATTNGKTNNANLSDCSLDDGDNSINTGTGNTSTATTTTGMVVSDISSGLNSSNGITSNDIIHRNNSLNENDIEMANDQIDNNLNIAHPIFGFRLGLIKPEPTDTGYETIEKNDLEKSQFVPDKDAGNINNINNDVTASNVNMNVKQEADNDDENVNRNEQLVKELNGLTSNQTSTPNEKFTNGVHMVESCNMKLPPLRVAPFTQATSDMVTDSKKVPSRSPPPLTMPSTVRSIYANNLNNMGIDNHIHNMNNSSSNNNYSSINNKYNTIKNGKLSSLAVESAVSSSSSLNLGPKISMGPNVPPIRLSKEITIQQTTNKPNYITPSNFPKLKQVPMRKTPYSLRPDRVIPDLDSSDSPPTSETSSCHYMDEDLTAIAESNNISSPTVPMKMYMKRKRRLDWQDPYTTTTATGTTSVAATGATAVTATTVPSAKIQKLNNNSCTFVNENPDNNSKASTSTLQENREEEAEHKETYQKLVTNVIRDVTATIRELQREMMQGFLKTQQDLIRQEHVFQMQQDEMLMKAFQEQTQNIMNTLTNLMTVDDNKKSNYYPNNHNHENHPLQDKTPLQAQSQPQPQSQTKSKPMARRPRGRPRKYHHNHHIIQKQQQQQQHVAYRKKYLKHVNKTKNKVKRDENALTATTDLYSDDANEEDLRGYKEAEEAEGEEELNNSVDDDYDEEQQRQQQQEQQQQRQQHGHQQRQEEDEQQQQQQEEENNQQQQLQNNENDAEALNGQAASHEVDEQQQEQQQQESLTSNHTNNIIVHMKHKKKYERYNNGNHNLKDIKDIK